MTTATRRLLVGVGIVASTLATTSMEADEPLPLRESAMESRVRPRGPVLAALVRDAADQSATFRRLARPSRRATGLSTSKMAAARTGCARALST